MDFTRHGLGGGPKIPAGARGLVLVKHRDGTSAVRFAKFGTYRRWPNTELVAVKA